MNPRQAIVVLVVSLLGTRAASAQWGPPPVEPELVVEFRITMTPDPDAEKLGAKPLENRVEMPGGNWQDRFTGRGCVIGPFDQTPVQFVRDGRGGVTFEVTCKGAPGDGTKPMAEWKGTLRDGKISGDVWVTLPGPPLSAEEVAARRAADRERVMSKVVYVEGRAINGEALRKMAEETDRYNDSLALQGRRLHYTFKTDQVEVVPIGSKWVVEAEQVIGPTTRPPTRPDKPATVPPKLP